MLQTLGLALLGLCVGSFLTTVWARADIGFAGLATGRSRCPQCGTALGVADLVPLLCWLVRRGRCRHCNRPIAVAYPLIELTAAGIGLVAGWLMAATVTATIVAGVGWWLMALALIDLRTLRLPDILTLPLLAAGLGAAVTGMPPGLAVPTPSAAMLGAVAGFAILAAVRWLYARLRHREGLGLGDAKLAAAAGAWLGPEALSWLILLGSLGGLLVAYIRHRGLRGDLAIPFGPPLALAFWLLLVLAQAWPDLLGFASAAIR